MSVTVLWLTPDKPEDISVGRRRIADHLGRRGCEVELRGTTPRTVWRSLWERQEYDVVIGTTRAGALAGALIRVAGGPPLVVDHVDPILQFAETASWLPAAAVRTGENLAFRLSAATLFVYEEERKRVERRAPRAVKTDLGVEFDRFANPDESVSKRAAERLSNFALRDRVVVYIGGLEPLYHVDALLDAVDLLDGWSLVVAGAGSLQSTVEKVHDGRSVVYLGTVPHEEIPGYLHAADVAVSLVDDPHTLKVLEYGAAGIPVVQLDGRARRRFGERVTYTDGSPEDVARAIADAVDRDPTRLRSLAQRFDWPRLADTYEEVITNAK